MFSNIKIIAIMAVISSASMHISAQTNSSVDVMAQKQTNRIKAGVTGVTQEQQTKILAVEQEWATTMESIRGTNTTDKEARHSQLKTAKETRDTKIKDILTADQFTQYQAMEAQHRNGGYSKGGNQ